jgi:hypothetical protein
LIIKYYYINVDLEKPSQDRSETYFVFGSRYLMANIKSKIFSVQGWTCPEGSRTLRLPDFQTFSI